MLCWTDYMFSVQVMLVCLCVLPADCVVLILYFPCRLCWSDSVFDQVECLTLNGNERTVFVSLPGTHIYSITTFQDYLVWTDRDKRNGIHAGIRKSGEKIRGVIHPGIGKAYDVITYDESLQPLSEGKCLITHMYSWPIYIYIYICVCVCNVIVWDIFPSDHLIIYSRQEWIM